MTTIRQTATARRLNACAWCERIHLDKWVSAEEAIAKLRTFEWPQPPVFTSRICDDCLRAVLAARDEQRDQSHANAA